MYWRMNMLAKVLWKPLSIWCSNAVLQVLFGENPSGHWTLMFLAHQPLKEWIKMILNPQVCWGYPRLKYHFQIFASNMIDMIWMDRNIKVHDGSRLDVLPLLARIKRISAE
ncbi:hypothetical protein CJ030_MR2G027151 [Morella rubra]|uniref:Ubiquitin-like protease family profile domain-containing protein n=1 Tax=Morella rubra TaxID=262757 RepID=A0A6A1W8E0_9ROSI|nr:hypothetical protein CJ030_MR2G027151 [Morella rubra]